MHLGVADGGAGGVSRPWLRTLGLGHLLVLRQLLGHAGGLRAFLPEEPLPRPPHSGFTDPQGRRPVL